MSPWLTPAVYHVGGGPIVKPTRAEICSVVTSGMQGLYVDTNQFGRIPWWDAALPWLQDPSDRAAVYAAKLASPLKDRHQLIELPCGPPLYNEEDGKNVYAPSRGFGPLDWTNGNTKLDPKLEFLIEEVQVAGLIPVLFLGGDDGETGYGIARKQLPFVVDGLGSVMEEIALLPGWDGVFYGYSPQEIMALGAQFRELCPNGHFLIEMAEGEIPVGGGPADWTSTGAMKDWDGVLVEFDLNNLHQDSTWQISGRLLEHYHRPPDQPEGDDPNPPYYLKAGCARGPFFASGFEYKTFYWVRPGDTTEEQVATDRSYLRSVGWLNLC